MDVKKCTVCNIRIGKDNYKKDGNMCKNCYNIIRKKYNKNTFSENNNNEKKMKDVNSVNINNRTLIIGFSNCGKTYFMNRILFQKQEPIFIITRSLNQYPDVKTQASDEIQPLENFENSTVVFDDMLLSKQESNIDLFFTGRRHQNIDIYYISQNSFHLPKNIFRNKIILFKQTPRDIILIFHDIAGLDMILIEWKQLCCKAWENDYDFLQRDRCVKIGKGRYTIKNCNNTTYTEGTPETKPF